MIERIDVRDRGRPEVRVEVLARRRRLLFLLLFLLIHQVRIDGETELDAGNVLRRTAQDNDGGRPVASRPVLATTRAIRCRRGSLARGLVRGRRGPGGGVSASVQRNWRRTRGGLAVGRRLLVAGPSRRVVFPAIDVSLVETSLFRFRPRRLRTFRPSLFLVMGGARCHRGLVVVIGGNDRRLKIGRRWLVRRVWLHVTGMIDVGHRYALVSLGGEG